MANVRLDQNGIPKGPAYECTAPLAHRSNVTGVDSSDPVDASPGIDCGGYECCRLDLLLTGVGLTDLDVQVLFWNSRQSKWFAGASRAFSAAGQYAVMAPDVRGATVFLKVTGFSGTSFSLSVDYSLS